MNKCLKNFNTIVVEATRVSSRVHRNHFIRVSGFLGVHVTSLQPAEVLSGIKGCYYKHIVLWVYAL